MCKLQSSLGVHSKNTGQKRVSFPPCVFLSFSARSAYAKNFFSNIKVTSACHSTWWSSIVTY